MNDFNTLFPENLYHSYIIEAEIESTAPMLLEYLKERGDIKSASPDVLYQLYDSFTIGDALLIKDWHSKLSITLGKRICIIGTKFINNEAERALLKMLEEPALNTHFFIIVPNSNVLLDTIRSRTHIVRYDIDKKQKNQASIFVKLSPKERIEHIAEIIKNNKDNENSGGLRAEAIELVNGIEEVFHKQLKINKKNKETQFVLEELETARGYLGTSGASVKMILEHIALVL